MIDLFMSTISIFMQITQLNDESAVIGEIRNQWNFLTIFTHADTFGIECENLSREKKSIIIDLFLLKYNIIVIL